MTTVLPTLWINGPKSDTFEISDTRFWSSKDGVYGRSEFGAKYWQFWGLRDNRIVFLDHEHSGPSIGAVMWWFPRPTTRSIVQLETMRMRLLAPIWARLLQKCSSPEIAYFYWMERKFYGIPQ